MFHLVPAALVIHERFQYLSSSSSSINVSNMVSDLDYNRRDIYLRYIKYIQALRKHAGRIVEAFDVIDSFKIESKRLFDLITFLQLRSTCFQFILNTRILRHAQREFARNLEVSRGSSKYGC